MGEVCLNFSMLEPARFGWSVIYIIIPHIIREQFTFPAHVCRFTYSNITTGVWTLREQEIVPRGVSGTAISEYSISAVECSEQRIIAIQNWGLASCYLLFGRNDSSVPGIIDILIIDITPFLPRDSFFPYASWTPGRLYW